LPTYPILKKLSHFGIEIGLYGLGSDYILNTKVIKFEAFKRVGFEENLLLLCRSDVRLDLGLNSNKNFVGKKGTDIFSDTSTVIRYKKKSKIIFLV